MNRKEKLEKCLENIKALSERSDVEDIHGSADEELLDALLVLGASELVAAYKDLRTEKGFYYA